MPPCWPKPNAATLTIDANLIVCYLIGDHPDQAARAIIERQPVFVAATVRWKRNGCFTAPMAIAAPRSSAH